MKFNKRTTMNMFYSACGGCGTKVMFCCRCTKLFKNEDEKGIVYCDSADNVPNQGAVHLCESCFIKGK